MDELDGGRLGVCEVLGKKNRSRTEFVGSDDSAYNEGVPHIMTSSAELFKYGSFRLTL